ncbi:MAG: hypothetical protein LBT14_05485 [Treponema sp.]|jgi:hypothetical protein|nr:hypothetical protein [Treponema sp.]
MKRIVLGIGLACIMAGMLAAQSGPFGAPAEAVTVSGNLALVNGRIAVKSGNTIYYVAGIQQLIGFIDGLKEGATVTLEGSASSIPVAPEYRFLWVSALKFNGKEYDLSTTAMPGHMMQRNFQYMPGRGKNRPTKY